MKQDNHMPVFTIGILGGGQLGRMMAIAARYMGYRVAVLDPTEDCPAAQVSDTHIVAAYDDMEAIKQLAEVSNVVTYEFENVDLEAARYLENEGRLPQGSKALEVTQDREKEKTLMAELGLPIGSFSIVHSIDELKEAVQSIGFPSVLKTCRGGYDGKGQLKLNGPEDLTAAADFLKEKGRSILEEWITFEKEISIIFTRSKAGEITSFPLAENDHVNHILYKTTAPASVPTFIEEKALQAAEAIGEKIGIVGTFAIEMFLNGDELYLNEMAPRPHNSGHFTIEACNVSQFEQHVRAVCDMPLIPVVFHGASTMINLLGQDLDRYMDNPQQMTNAHLHIYGKKEAKTNRKMGHITYVGKKIEDVEQMMEKDLHQPKATQINN